LKKLFDLLCSNGSETISKEDTMKFWSKLHPELNTEYIFEDIDLKKTGKIGVHDWAAYWESYYADEGEKATVQRVISLKHINQLYS